MSRVRVDVGVGVRVRVRVRRDGSGRWSESAFSRTLLVGTGTSSCLDHAQSYALQCLDAIYSANW
jgi:hypothetical protein